MPILGVALGCTEGAPLEGREPGQEVTVLEQGVDGCHEVTRYSDLEVPVADDTDVTPEAPNTPHGESTRLVVDGNPRHEAYLRFNVAAVANLVRARLMLRAVDGSSNGPALHATSASWSGASLTWNTRPPPVGTALANVGAILTDSVVEYDVTSHITRSGPYGFVLIPEGGDGADFASREWPDVLRRPKLILTFGPKTLECNYRGTGGGVISARVAGGTGSDVPQRLAMDAAGGYAVAGRFNGPGTFGGPLNTLSGEALALSRFRADGTHQWTWFQSQSNAAIEAKGLVVTSLGNVLLAGNFMGIPDFGRGAPPETIYSSGAFIAKFSPSGQLVWVKTFRAYVDRDGVRDYEPIFIEALATDAEGSAVITGWFQGFSDMGSGILDAGQYSREGPYRTWGMFVAKFSWEGQPRWSHAFAAGEDEGTQGLTLATDSQGNVVVGGCAGRNNALGAKDRETPFVARFASAGQMQWVRRLEGGVRARGNVRGVAILPGDAVAFTVPVSGSFLFGGRLYSTRSESTEDQAVAVLEPSGADRWLRLQGGETGEIPLGLATDPVGNLVVMGSFHRETDLGGGLLNPWGLSHKTYVAKYGPDGTHRWSRAIDGVLESTLLGTTPLGDTYLGGPFWAPLEVGGGVYAPSGANDLLLLKLAP